jgi:hypothetical protein
MQREEGLRPHPQLELDRNACVPDGVTNGQVKLVIIKYMKEHPGNLDIDAGGLAIVAIKLAWPCRPGEVR